MASVIEQYVVLGELVEASGPVTAARLFHGLSIDEECVGRIREALERYGGRSAAFSSSMTDPSSTSRSMIESANTSAASTARRLCRPPSSRCANRSRSVAATR